MVLEGAISPAVSNRSSSTLSAFFEKTLKLTPPCDTVAPRGKLFPRIFSITLFAELSVFFFFICCLFHFDRLYIPDVVAVFPYGAVRRKLSHSGHVQNRHADPVVLIAIGRTHPVLAVDV